MQESPNQRVNSNANKNTEAQMLRDAKEAPNCVAELLSRDHDIYQKLAAEIRTADPSVIATIARGSSDHAASYASCLIPHCTGKVVASIHPSTVTVLNSPLHLKGQFALSISQGGESPDILRTTDVARESGALTASIVNQKNSTLSRKTHFNLPQHCGTEGIAATKTVIATMTSIARLVAEWTGNEDFSNNLALLPKALKEACKLGQQISDQLLPGRLNQPGSANIYVLSRGYGLSVAQELSLKFKETCGVHAEAFSSAEVRHGPREIVGKNFLIIALALPGSGEKDVISVSSELRDQGAEVILIAPPGNEETITLPKVRDLRLAPIVALQMLYPWIARSSVAMGMDPDRPKTLKSKIIKTV